MAEMIKANKDSKILIKEKDREFVHVAMRRLTIIPGDEKHPAEFDFVQCFDVKTFERFFNTGNELENRKFLNAMNVDTARVVHDPRLSENDDNLSDEELAQKKIDAKKSAADKRAATIAAKKAAKAEIKT